MSKIKSYFLRTDSKNRDFIYLVEKLDFYLAQIDGDDHAFYNQFNQIVNLAHVIVFYQDNIAVSCGAIKQIDENTYELKRMFAEPEVRGKGAAFETLNALEKWAFELGAVNLVLETGKRQIDAVKFYQKNGYKIIDNYGQYFGIENSVCFSKSLG